MGIPTLVWIFASFDFEQEVMPLLISSSIIKKCDRIPKYSIAPFSRKKRLNHISLVPFLLSYCSSIV